MSTIRNQRFKGQLELTWTNKDQRLLSHGEDTYEWTTPDDYRVSEVRLLHDIAAIGETRKDVERAKDNLLIRGDALHALTALKDLPEFAAECRGKVRLAYIDPPFNTGQMFEQYNDAVEHSIWLTQMRDRLIQIQDLLANDGSIWVHLDDTEQAYCRVVLDEVFGRSNFVATIVWQRRHSRSNDAVMSVSHDFILVYAKDSRRFASTRNRLTLTPEQATDYANPDSDVRGPWRSISFSAPNLRPNLSFEIVAPSGKRHVPPEGRCWRTTESNFKELLDDNRIYFGAKGDGVPRVKQFLNEAPGIVPNTWWPHTEVGHTEEAAKESAALFGRGASFATPKPERLISRIISIASDPGDIVLDCFAGSATTAAVAHKMGRRWVTSELSQDNYDNYNRPRLEKVVSGEDPGGITRAMEWRGGGGFRCLEVGPSMFEADEDGGVLLAAWVTNGAFAEAVCAQLGYERLGEEGRPFCGRKGRMRLAVVDGVAGDAEVDFLVSRLTDGERLTLVAKAATEEAQDRLRTLSPGSRLRTAPRDLLRVRSHGKAAR